MTVIWSRRGHIGFSRLLDLTLTTPGLMKIEAILRFTHPWARYVKI